MTRTLWKTARGQLYTFDAMSNEQLANVLKYLETYAELIPNSQQVYDEVYNEASERGLTLTFLSGAWYPYKDVRTGVWMRWSERLGRDVPVSQLI